MQNRASRSYPKDESFVVRAAAIPQCVRRSYLEPEETSGARAYP